MNIETLFPLLIGIAMILTPVMQLPTIRRERRRTELVLGTVIDQEEQRTIVGHRPSSGTPVKTDHAIIQYQVDGQVYTCVSSEGATWTVHPVGSEQWVCYDPEDPTNADVVPGTITKVFHFLLYIGLPVTGVIIILRTVVN